MTALCSTKPEFLSLAVQQRLLRWVRHGFDLLELQWSKLWLPAVHRVVLALLWVCSEPSAKSLWVLPELGSHPAGGISVGAKPRGKKGKCALALGSSVGGVWSKDFV